MSIDLDIALLNACREGSIDKVKSALDQGADVNVTNNHGHTALRIARSKQMIRSSLHSC